MSPRTGRPKAVHPKIAHFNVRLDENDYARLQTYCNENNITKADVARMGIKKVLDEKK